MANYDEVGADLSGQRGDFLGSIPFQQMGMWHDTKLFEFLSRFFQQISGLRLLCIDDRGSRFGCR